MVAKIQVEIFWVVTQCSDCCLNLHPEGQGSMVLQNDSTQHHNPKDLILHKIQDIIIDYNS